MTGFSSLFENDSKKIKVILVFFLVVYHSVLFYSLSNEPVFLNDSEEYMRSAISYETERNFYAGPHTTETDYRLYSKRTPLYPFVLFSFHSFNLHWNYIYILQAFLGLLNIYLAFVLLNRFIKNTTAYLLLTVFILLTPSQFIYSQFIMADLWLQTFIMLCLGSFGQFLKTRNSIWLVTLIVFSTLGALTKPVFLFASFVIALICLYYFISQKSRKLLAISVALPFLSWFNVSNQNEKHTGLFHYSSIGYINLLHYNTSLYLDQAIGKAEADKLLEPLMTVPHTKVEFIKHYEAVNRVCLNAILSHLGGYLVYHSKGIVYFFLDPGRFDLYNFFRIEEENSKGFLHSGADKNKLKTMLNSHPNITLGLAIVFLMNILKTIGFFCFTWLHKKNTLVLAGAAIVFYVALLTGPLGASRFALPVELIIICFASVFYCSIFKKG